MNLENIASLTAILSKTGFENLSYRLVQHICCRPMQFVLSERIVKNSDYLTCELCIERQSEDFVFSYYDASLIREQLMPSTSINQIALKSLEAKMMDIDWQLGDSQTIFRLNDESTWSREKNIEEVIAELARLSSTVDGKMYADILKVRFWSGTLLETLTGSLSAIRSKLEVSQRFYIVGGEGINVEEALRFLQNKWLEKRMAAKRRERDNENLTDTNSKIGEGHIKGLIKKKRNTRVKKIKP